MLQTKMLIAISMPACLPPLVLLAYQIDKKVKEVRKGWATKMDTSEGENMLNKESGENIELGEATLAVQDGSGDDSNSG